ncbi:hypothetical protein C5S42_11715 [Candidatus Methanomarinus sp.]|nr:hypothetical protein C5S42_11715 [ANME-2 cluster archaeon]
MYSPYKITLLHSIGLICASREKSIPASLDCQSEILKYAGEKKTMWLMRELKKLSAVQKKLKTKTLAKNRMHKLSACVYVEIMAIPLWGHNGAIKGTNLDNRVVVNYTMFESLVGKVQ